MRIKNFDHIVLTTQDIDKCLAFYVDLLGMELDRTKNRYAVKFGSQKINIHCEKGEFTPAAEYPTYGSLDICLVVEGSIEDVETELQNKGFEIELGIVDRTGAMGPIRSIYLRDPDGNLVELSTYA